MIIHQTWKDENVPEKWVNGHNKWKDFAKKYHWDYKLWTDDDNRQLIVEHFPWFLETYDSYELPIMRADAIRPFILYEHGGLYCDLDIAPNEKFIHLFRMYQSYPVVLCEARKGNAFSGNSLTNAIMWSNVDHCDFWNHVCRSLLDPFQGSNWRNLVAHRVNYFKPLLTTGPAFLSLAYQKYQKENEKQQTNEHKKKFDSIVCVPSALIQPYSNSHGDTDQVTYTTDQAVITTSLGGSWHQGDAKFFIGLGKSLSHLHWVILGLTFFFITTTIIFMYLYLRK